MQAPTKSPTDHCLNCGADLPQKAVYCTACGQRVRNTPLPVRTFLGDFVTDYFTVDTKLFRSVKLLLLSPGTMTRYFNTGQRLSFIPPFRFYIFVSFVYFFLLAIITRESNLDFMRSKPVNHMAQLADLDSLMADTASLGGKKEIVAAYHQVRASTQVDTTMVDQPFSVSMADNESFVKGSIAKIFEERWKRIQENPTLFKQSFFKSVSIGVFFLLPIFGLLLMAVNYRRSSFYVNHLVLSVHYHTFLFVMFCAYLLFGLWSDQAKHWIFLVILLGYLFLIGRAVRAQKSTGRIQNVLIVVAFLLFGLMLLPPILSDPGSSDIFLLFAVASAYLTLGLMNAYSQPFLKAVVKSVLIVPVYMVVIASTLVLVALVGVLLS
jgi:hypothetical protein